MIKLLPILVATLPAWFAFNTPVHAYDYVIDTKDAHASVQFRIKHLGYSWLYGRFNKFEGSFSYDERNPSTAKVQVTIDTSSLDSNHAERDKHLRGKDFLDVSNYPQAKFISTGFTEQGGGKALLEGNLTLHGVTKPISIEVEHIGHGPDPWGTYRRGFAGTTKLTLSDFDIDYNLGPAAREVEMILSVEGVRPHGVPVH